MASDRQCQCGRRNFLRRLAALASGALLLPGWARAANQQGGVRHLEGEVLVNGHPAVLGQVLVAGDQVRTGAAAHLIARLGNDALQLRPNSALQLEAATEDTLISGLRLLNGGLLAVFGKGPRRWVRTPTVTAGIRGTAVYVESSPVAGYFCLCYGEVDVRAMRNGTELPSRIIAAGHHLALATDAQSGDGLTPMDMHGHSDEELIALEALVGRVPEFLRR